MAGAVGCEEALRATVYLGSARLVWIGVLSQAGINLDGRDLVI